MAVIILAFRWHNLSNQNAHTFVKIWHIALENLHEQLVYNYRYSF